MSMATIRPDNASSAMSGSAEQLGVLFTARAVEGFVFILMGLVLLNRGCSRTGRATQRASYSSRWRVRPPLGRECEQKVPPPNPRVQRTRPCASLRGSPLTRHPLGRPEPHSRWPLGVALFVSSFLMTRCSTTKLVGTGDLSGHWIGTAKTLQVGKCAVVTSRATAGKESKDTVHVRITVSETGHFVGLGALRRASGFRLRTRLVRYGE